MLGHADILQIYPTRASTPGVRAVRFAACIASRLGAKLYSHGAAPSELGYGFYDMEETALTRDQLDSWLAEDAGDRCRIVISTGTKAGELAGASSANSVFVQLDDWQTEETLFASSGISLLLGDPARPPITPAANYAAHTIGYSVFAALMSVALMHRRYGRADDAIIYGDSVLSWINWKTAIYAQYKRILKRQGERAEWPMVACKDGFVAFLFMTWDSVIELIGDPVLKAPDLQTFELREKNRDKYMKIIQRWCEERTKAEIAAEFERVNLPGAPALTIPDLLTDPLLEHRQAFERASDGGAVPRLPHRIIDEKSGDAPEASQDGGGRALPLAGMRVLDFGIITAGAGVSALLADMGAEVIKIESHNRPDPFRKWPGANDAEGSPVFKCNNRNKLGIAIDLKTPEGKKAFFDLAETADIVLENYRRGVLDRLGLTFEALAEANPSILLASISSQGMDGPGTRHPTFGSTLEASSGFAALTTYGEGQPYVSGRNLNYPDQIVCLYGAAIVAAYAVECRLTGTARHVDVAQRDTAIYQLGDIIAYVAKTGNAGFSAISAAGGRPLLSDTFLCADDRYVALTAGDESVLGKIDGLDSLDSNAVAAWAGGRSSEAAVSAFLKAGGGGAVVRDGSDLLADQVLRDRNIFANGPNGALVKGFPFQLLKTPMTIWGNSPAVGEHTEEILGRLTLQG